MQWYAHNPRRDEGLPHTSANGATKGAGDVK